MSWVTKEEVTDSDSFPKIGVQFSVFKEFIASNGGRERFRGLTTTDVCNTIVKPLTAVLQCSYCEFLLHPIPSEDEDEEGGEEGSEIIEAVGEVASVFISHAWKYKFLDVVNALELHFKETPNIVIWFDLFSNNQHRPDVPYEWWATTFKSAIKDFGRTVMVLAPWDGPIPFTRAWCLFEIYCTIVSESEFEVAMSGTEKDTFLDEITKDRDAYYKMLANIDVKKSESSNPDDLVRIFEVVEKEVGFSKVNTMICEKMRSWVDITLKSSLCDPVTSDAERGHDLGLKAVRNMMAELAPSNARGLEVVTDLLGAMGSEGDDLGLGLKGMMEGMAKLMAPILVDSEKHRKREQVKKNIVYAKHLKETKNFDDALDLLQECLDISIKLDLKAEIVETYLEMSDVYSLIALFDKAIDAYKKIVDVVDTSFDSGSAANSFKGVILTQIGRAYLNSGNYELALEWAEKGLAILIAERGADHPVVALTYMSVAQLYSKQRRYDDALELAEKGLAILIAEHGADHPAVAGAYMVVSRLYSKQRRYDDALELAEKGLAIRIAEHGADHPALAGEYTAVAMVYRDQRRYDDALELCEKALEIVKVKLGADALEVADVYENMADVYSTQGDFDRSLELLNKCLVIQKAKLGVGHPHVALSYENIAVMKRNKETQNNNFEQFGITSSVPSLADLDRSSDHSEDFLSRYSTGNDKKVGRARLAAEQSSDSNNSSSNSSMLFYSVVGVSSNFQATHH
jgi:tetratricopeptide (TPR) repeat protein